MKEQHNLLSDKKLSAYALAGAAVLLSPGIAKADTITLVTPGTTVSEPGSVTFDGITILAQANSFFTSANEIDASAAANTGLLTDPGDTYIAALAFGALINPASSSSFSNSGKMVSTVSLAPGDWSSTGSSSYLGFYFTDPTGAHAGWADIATTANASGSSFTLINYAYQNTAGDTITAGQTTDAAVAVAPEPSSLSLLALGATGLIALRKRTQAHA